MSTSGSAIPYRVQGSQFPKPQAIHVLNGNFVFDLSDYYLCDFFQDTNPGVKRDLPVRTASFRLLSST